MIIVLEGPDGAGKSTLAQEFVRRGFEYRYHDDPPKPGEDKFATYTKAILSVAPTEDVVFDRFAPSEHVYGLVRRGETQIGIEQLRLINRLLYSRGAFTIFCLPPFATVEKNWRARLKDELVQDSGQLEKLYHAYDALRSSEYDRLHAIAYDYSVGPSIFGFHATKLSIPLLPFYLPEGVIGHPSARFLFVGEQSSDVHDLAFYSYSSARSAHFLNLALWEAGFKEHELCFTNARYPDGGERDIKSIYDGRIVIALGDVAGRVCSHQGVPYLAAPHPQYVRRFKSKRREQYVAMLRMFRGSDL